jgi:hypothetical protein
MNNKLTDVREAADEDGATAFGALMAEDTQEIEDAAMEIADDHSEGN